MKLSKWRIIVSSIITILPTAFGLLVYKFLPKEIPIHFGINGAADGFGNAFATITVVPLVFLVFHLFCLWLTQKYYKGHTQNKKVMELIYWILPTVSVFVMLLMYAVAFDLPVRISVIFYALMSLLFIFVGNYLPKCRRNQMMGIKIKWTLANEENWNMTHRFAGKVWFACGICCIPCMLLPNAYFVYPMFGIIAVTVLVPSVYSYRYYKKQVRHGTYSQDETVYLKLGKWGKIAVTGILVIILVVVAILMFTGNLEFSYSNREMTIEASYYEDITVSFSDVEKVEYQEEIDLGKRAFGFGSYKLSMGVFVCEQFGRYTRYTYNGCDACVVLTVKGKTVVINRPDRAQTKALYQDILGRVEAFHESN